MSIKSGCHTQCSMLKSLPYLLLLLLMVWGPHLMVRRALLRGSICGASDRTQSNILQGKCLTHGIISPGPILSLKDSFLVLFHKTGFRAMNYQSCCLSLKLFSLQI